IARLSEAPGYFDSDNLISNETSYLHAIGTIKDIGTTGGAYVGVGPDQNFSYIATIRPDIAYMIDIRRDNMLMHLLFKALFEESRNRLEFLCHWTGRPIPGDAAAFDDRPIEAIVARLDSLVPNDSSTRRDADSLIARVSRLHVPLTAVDSATMRRFLGE